MLRISFLLLWIASSYAGLSKSLTQYGLSVEFSDAVQWGQYVNGDYWVIGPATLVSTSPTASGGRNGFQINPNTTNSQPFDSRAAGYQASLQPSLPVSLHAGEVIVKAQSLSKETEEVGKNPTYLETAIVVTIVERAPTTGAFRPGYFRAQQTYPALREITINDIHWANLPSLQPPPKANLTKVSLKWLHDRFERVQLDHLTEWDGSMIHPSDDMETYGANIASDCAVAANRIILNDAPIDKSNGSIGYIQYAIDLYSIVNGGGKYSPNGGWMNGRKIVLTMVSVLLDETNMKILVLTSTGINGQFSEDYEINRPAGNIPLFGLKQGTTEEEYWKLVLTCDGQRIMSDPYNHIDGGCYPGGYYQFCCTAQPWKGEALPQLIDPNIASIFNDSNFLTYVKRWVTFGAWAKPDPCAPPTGACSDGSGRCSGWLKGPCGKDNKGKCMLDTKDYKKTWGPDGTGDCIKGSGRFPSRHGSTPDGGYYGSHFVDVMYDEYGPKN